MKYHLYELIQFVESMINQTSQMQALQAFIEKKRQEGSSFEEEFTFADFQSFVKSATPFSSYRSFRQLS